MSVAARAVYIRATRRPLFSSGKVREIPNVWLQRFHNLETPVREGNRC